MKREVNFWSLLAQVITLSLSLLAIDAHSEIIHEERSRYRDITIREVDGVRCMLFNIHRFERNQSCLSLDDPETLYFNYTRMTFAGLLLSSAPERILIVGHGGGSVPLALSDLFPEAKIDSIEIDEAVERVAEEFFYFQETENMKVHIADGRLFIKRAGLRGETYDYILLDAFFGDYMPEHMLTREFLLEVKEIMHEDSVLVANTFSHSDFYHHESVTYQQVFGEFYNFKLPGWLNRIIVAQLDTLPEPETLAESAEALAAKVGKYGVPLIDYPQYLSLEVDWDTTKRPLTDQYSPGNLLRDGD